MHDANALHVMRQARLHEPLEALTCVIDGASMQIEARADHPLATLEIPEHVGPMPRLEILAVIGFTGGRCVRVGKRGARALATPARRGRVVRSDFPRRIRALLRAR